MTILLSNDGGFTFPTTLLASTPKGGTQPIVVPNVATNVARIRVECRPERPDLATTFCFTDPALTAS